MTLVKFCGITRLEEAVTAQRLGAWAIGEVFAPSRRRIDLDTAAIINASLGGGIAKIGVFVNEDLEKVLDIVRYCSLDMVQLHGEEPPEYLDELPVPAIKVFSLTGPADENDIKRWRPWAYGFDTHSLTEIRGGTGHSFNWEWLGTLRDHEKIMLAGGLNPENVPAAIGRMKPLAVDVSSGVEYPTGGKDPYRMEQFIKQVREADRYES
ncbi:MAG: phosphoribosylanthranilate isomerase [Deltaproteobacteria bacterium]